MQKLVLDLSEPSSNDSADQSDDDEYSYQNCWNFFDFNKYAVIYLGQQINQYIILQNIGLGTFSSVWLCKNIDNYKYYCLKVYKVV